MPKKVRRTRIKEDNSEISGEITRTDATMKVIEHAGDEPGLSRPHRKPGHATSGPRAAFLREVNKPVMREWQQILKVNKPVMEGLQQILKVNKPVMAKKAGPDKRRYAQRPAAAWWFRGRAAIPVKRDG